jgi:hypothetical protein
MEILTNYAIAQRYFLPSAIPTFEAMAKEQIQWALAGMTCAGCAHSAHGIAEGTPWYGKRSGSLCQRQL